MFAIQLDRPEEIGPVELMLGVLYALAIIAAVAGVGGG